MARRNDHTREELKEMALETAERIIESNGLAGLSARKVAAGMGYSAGSLYTLFHNLDDLCWQLNDRTLTTLLQAMDAVCDEDAAQCLHAYAETYHDFAMQYPERWHLLFEHRSSDTSPLPEALTMKIASLFGHVERCLAYLFPDVSNETLQLRSRALWSGIHGITQLTLGDKLFVDGQLDDTAIRRQLIDSLLAGWTQGE